jgi:hypothetical protein
MLERTTATAKIIALRYKKVKQEKGHSTTHMIESNECNYTYY